ncbi:MAG: hypothetical protein ACRBDI_00645 [Alphaproteobacteria bacterium]
MSCNLPIEKGVREAADCKCYNAVMKAYSGMVSVGESDQVARDVAITVYSYHHPEDTKANQALTVDRWVHEGHLH